MPDGGFAKSVAFDPNGPLADGLRREHDSAIANLYYGDPAAAPAFEAVSERVHANTALLECAQ